MTRTQITWDRICICVLIVHRTISHFAFWNALCWSSEWWLAMSEDIVYQIVCGRSEWKHCAAGLERASGRRWTELCAGQLIMEINSFALFNTIFMKMCYIFTYITSQYPQILTLTLLHVGEKALLKRGRENISLICDITQYRIILKLQLSIPFFSDEIDTTDAWYITYHHIWYYRQNIYHW